MKKLLLLALAGLVVSCSKGGGGGSDNGSTAATVTNTSVNSAFCDGTAGVSNGVPYNNGSYYPTNAWPYNQGVGGSASCNCSPQVYSDFSGMVWTSCGFYGNNGTSLYSTQCKNGFIAFRNKYPTISCNFNNSGVYGVLSTSYLDYNINVLQQSGL